MEIPKTDRFFYFVFLKNVYYTNILRNESGT